MATAGFKTNQIVKGKRAGTFVILGFRSDLGFDGEGYAQLKEVDPNDFTRVGRGELSLPLDEIESIN